MGASGWSYFIPYQNDIAQALQNLRQKIFEDGDYQKLWLYYEVSEEVFEVLDELEEKDWAFPDHLLVDTLVQILESKQIRADLPKPPRTVEEVLQRNGIEASLLKALGYACFKGVVIYFILKDFRG